MTATPWWERMPGRLQHEEQALQAAGIGYVRDEAAFAAGLARYRVTVPGPDGPLDLVATFPDSYPYFKPHVAAPGLGYRHHWNPRSGEVCLLGAGLWQPGSDTLARLLQEQWPGVIDTNCGNGRASGGELLEVDQAEPVSVYASFEPGTQLVLAGDPGVTGAGQRGDLQVALAHEEPLRGYVLGLRTADGAITAAAGRIYAGELPRTTGRWLMLAEAPADLTAQGFWRAAVAAEPGLKQQLGWSCAPQSGLKGQAAAFGPQVQVVLVGFPEEVARRQLGTGWVALVRRRASSRKAPSYAQLVRVERAGPSDLYRRAPELHGLTDKRVLIVGAGGLGSALTLELGRLPLKELSIVDGDVVDAATSVRFPSAFRFGGAPKALALRQLVTESQPYTEVSAMTAHVGQARPDGEDEDQHAALEDKVRQVDLVIDATADTDVQYYLSDLCREQKVPYLVASR